MKNFINFRGNDSFVDSLISICLLLQQPCSRSSGLWSHLLHRASSNCMHDQEWIYVGLHVRMPRTLQVIALVCPVMVGVVVVGMCMSTILSWGQMRRLENLLKELSQFRPAHVINFCNCFDVISMHFVCIFRFIQ